MVDCLNGNVVRYHGLCKQREAKHFSLMGMKERTSLRQLAGKNCTYGECPHSTAVHLYAGIFCSGASQPGHC